MFHGLVVTQQFRYPSFKQDIACLNTKYVCVCKIALASWFLFSSPMFICIDNLPLYLRVFCTYRVFTCSLAMPKQIQLNGIILDRVLYDEPPESLLLLPLPLPFLFAIAYGNREQQRTHSAHKREQRRKKATGKQKLPGRKIRRIEEVK